MINGRLIKLVVSESVDIHIQTPQHISLVIVRAHSTRPMASGYKHMTKDSAFESGENGHPYRRRPSLDYHRSE
uniref:Uncharacterized protein n=1 Tax=Wuchereria bancrofti TaxID=6293 RepID=A0AAF5Q793_WUCBA